VQVGAMTPAPTQRRVRVAHVTTVDLSLRYLLANQLGYLQRLGYDVTGISATGPDVPWLESRGLRHIAVPMTRAITPFADVRALAELTLLFRRERFDIVHTHTPKAGVLGQLAARAAKVPHVVTTIHGFYFNERTKPLKRAFYVGLEKLATRPTEKVLSQNPEDVKTAIAEGICRPDQIELLGNGIDLTRFHPGAVSAETIAKTKAELGIPTDALVVGFVGRLVEEKGILELFRAFAELATGPLKNARLLLVGPRDEGRKDAVSPDRVHALGIGSQCVFVGMRLDVEVMYALMDIFVLPSHREGFPRSVMEAAAMAKPAVVTDIRGCRQTVIADSTGLIVPVKDPPALARAILSLAEAPTLRREMGARGLTLAREEFDEERVFRRVAATYEELVGPPRSSERIRS
jgi:glycosyltransferase involved in cell wall biosynthesis